MVKTHSVRVLGRSVPLWAVGLAFVALGLAAYFPYLSSGFAADDFIFVNMLEGAVPYDPLLGRFEEPWDEGTSQTCVYTTTQTQELRDGEWVTVESKTTSNGDIAPDEAMRRAMAMLRDEATPITARDPIPLSQEPTESSPTAKDVKRDGSVRRRQRIDHLPLELDEFRPDEEEGEREPSVGAARNNRD